MKLLVHIDSSTRDSDRIARVVSKSYVKFRGVPINFDSPTPGNSEVRLRNRGAIKTSRDLALMTEPSALTDSNPSITDLSQLASDGFLNKLEVARQGWRKSLSGRERPREDSVASSATRMSVQSHKLTQISLDESLEIADQILSSADLEQDVDLRAAQERQGQITSRTLKSGVPSSPPVEHLRRGSDNVSGSKPKKLKLTSNDLLEVRSASLPLPTNASPVERRSSTLPAQLTISTEAMSLAESRRRTQNDGDDRSYQNLAAKNSDEAAEKAKESLLYNEATTFSLQEFPHMVSHENAATDTMELTDDPSSMTRWLSKLAEHYIQREKAGKLVNLGGVAVIKTCFATRTREINKWERGCWRWNTKDWPFDHQRTVMKRVKEHIGNGHYGSSSYCKLRCGPDESIHTHAMGTTQVWCFGEQAQSVFVGLLITTQSERLPTYSLQWVDADGIVIMGGLSRVIP